LRKKEVSELLDFVNNIVIGYFQKEYGKDIFLKLEINNSSTLKKIIEKLTPLKLLNIKTDIKGDAFEYFIKKYLSKNKKDLGEYFTPRHIVKFMVKLIKPKYNEKIYDPFCGTGGMLIESFKQICNSVNISSETLNTLTKETIYGNEITLNARITKMNMILTGDGHNNIQKINSIANPMEKKFDVCITNMPFSLKALPEYSSYYQLDSSNGDSLCIQHCIKSIKENGRIAIIVPDGILFDKKFTKLREFIYKNSFVKYIISLPIYSFKPYAIVKSNILILENVNIQKNMQKDV
jgi:type I restriction enzyme M protein